MSEAGVVIGRFQIDELHSAHMQCIEEVRKRHGKVIVLIGVASALGSKRNPLDYPAREQMVRSNFHDVTILPLMDQSLDELWSEEVDRLVSITCPVNGAILYGGRDSCLPHYKGRFKIKELEVNTSISATEIRNTIGDRVRNSKDFRAGVIYSAYNQYSRVFPTVDIAIIKNDTVVETTRFVLMGTKHHQGPYHFPGGFVSPTDLSLEDAARRELFEETSLTGEDFKYVFSTLVSDWRYEKEEDKIMTSLFVCKYQFGALKANDDLQSLSWIPIDNLDDVIISASHMPLVKKLQEYLKIEEKQNV